MALLGCGTVKMRDGEASVLVLACTVWVQDAFGCCLMPANVQRNVDKHFSVMFVHVECDDWFCVNTGVGGGGGVGLSLALW